MPTSPITRRSITPASTSGSRQLRNLLAGTRPQNNPTTVDTNSNADTDYVLYNTGLAAQQQYFMPNGIASFNHRFRDRRYQHPAAVLAAQHHAGGRAVGRGRIGPGNAVFQSQRERHDPDGRRIRERRRPAITQTRCRAGSSLNIRDIIIGLPPDAADDNYNTFDPFPVPLDDRAEFVNGVTVNPRGRGRRS